MTDPGSPADMGPGYRVRVRLGGGLAYSTPRMTREDAQAVAVLFRENCAVARRDPDGRREVPFQPDGVEEVWLVVDHVKSAELLRLDAAGRGERRVDLPDRPGETLAVHGRRRGDQPGSVTIYVASEDAGDAAGLVDAPPPEAQPITRGPNPAVVDATEFLRRMRRAES